MRRYTTLNEQISKMQALMGLPIEEQDGLMLEKMSNEEIYQKYYSKIPVDDFKQIIQADPSMKQDGSIGKYTKWLLSLYQKGNLKGEDLYKAKEYLTLYGKNFNHVKRKDINSFKSLADLYSEVEKFKENPNDYASNSEKEAEIKKEAEKLYEDNKWIVINPKSKEASCYYGKGTQWCTAADKSDNKFDDYNNRGKLYINIDKINNRKFQFHFEDGQFMNENDDTVEMPLLNVGMTGGLIKFYQNITGKEDPFSKNGDDSIIKINGNNISVYNYNGKILKEKGEYNFNTGNKIGKWEQFNNGYDQSVVGEVNYDENGNKNGTANYLRNDGKEKVEVTYKNNILDGEVKIFKGDNIIAKANNSNGKLNGGFIYYYGETGKAIYRGNFNNDILTNFTITVEGNIETKFENGLYEDSNIITKLELKGDRYYPLFDDIQAKSDVAKSMFDTGGDQMKRLLASHASDTVNNINKAFKSKEY